MVLKIAANVGAYDVAGLGVLINDPEESKGNV
jgi:hypothetical protein